MDYHSDTAHRRLTVLAQAVTCDLRKTAAAYEDTSADDAGKLPARAFADSVNREYPVHTKEAAVLSAAYFFAEHPDDTGPETVREGLAKAAAFWDVEDEIAQIRSDLSVERRQPKYALDLQLDGAVLRHFPWHDKASLEKTAADFVSNRHNLPRVARVTTADNLLAAQGETSSKFASDVEAAVERCSGLGVLDGDKAAEAVMERSYRLRKHAEHKESVKKLAQVVGLLDADDADAFKTAVDAFSAFDEETGLARQYGRGMLLPEDALAADVSLAEKKAENGVVHLSNGQAVRLADIDWEKVSEIDPDLAELVDGDNEKAAEVLPTWPRPDADVLVQMLGLQTV